ncbi:DUF1353 domain-containing protein [Methylorubrum subtropicum]|uniref:DUF1353 domain-containing protein n=1 Tax=Methylorubrum subtropicum TaxID=3138812 RepID=UPI00399C566C
MKVVLNGRRTLSPVASIRPFFEWDYYYITESLTWKSDTDPNHTISIPSGFVTDLASIPRVFWSILPKTSAYTYPAIIHDYLYWFQPQNYTRKSADEVLKTTMQELNISKIKIFIIFISVRLWGGTSWKHNKTARERGEKRVLKVFPTELTTTWATWKNKTDVFE